MQHLPIFFDVKQQLCVVIGGGEIATRKVSLLCRAQAKVQVVSPELCPALQNMLADGKIEHISKTYADNDLDNAVLVIGATDNLDVNRQIAQTAKAKREPVVQRSRSGGVLRRARPAGQGR